MPKAVPRSWEMATESLCRRLIRDGCYSPRTIRFYREHSNLVGSRLQEVVGHSIIPTDLTKDHVVKLLEKMRAEELSIAFQKNLISALKKICEHYDHYVMKKVRIMWPSDTRPNVDWLTPTQAKQILDADLSPLQEVMVALELCAGLRRIEILRLTVADVHPTFIEVHGKGHIGGKLRSVPIQDRTRKALDRWLDERSFLVETCDDPQYISDALIVYRHGRYIYPYSDVKSTGIDRHLKEICKIVQIDFSHHTLRRTFARQLWLSGAPLVTIAKILGHSTTEQTLKYIGANHDDMASAMALLQF